MARVQTGHLPAFPSSADALTFTAPFARPDCHLASLSPSLPPFVTKCYQSNKSRLWSCCNSIMRSLLAASLLVLVCPPLTAAAPAPQASVRVSPGFPSSGDALAFAIATCVQPYFPMDPPVVTGSTITLRIESVSIDTTPLPLACEQIPARHATLGALPAGSYIVELRLDDQLIAATAFDVRAETNSLFLRGRFRAEAFWTGGDGTEHSVGAAQVSDESGAFWFFTSDSAELTLKLLDGRGVNGHFWVFIGALTNVAWRVNITDTSIVCGAAPCGERSYAVAAGQTQNIIDLKAY